MANLCFDEKLLERFNTPGNENLISELEAAYSRLLAWRKEFIEFDNSDVMTNELRALQNCQVIEQALLHRSERLMVASGTMVLQDNVYGLTLIVRGHFETTAVLGYLCHRLQSFIDGNIKLDAINFDIGRTLMGAKHELFEGKLLEPPNILTCLEKADLFFERITKSEKRGLLKDCHAWLSEFSHPNFNSNASAFERIKGTNRFEFRHTEKLRKEEVDQFEYLDISVGLFEKFFEAFRRLSIQAFS